MFWGDCSSFNSTCCSTSSENRRAVSLAAPAWVRTSWGMTVTFSFFHFPFPTSSRWSLTLGIDLSVQIVTVVRGPQNLDSITRNQECNTKHTNTNIIRDGDSEKGWRAKGQTFDRKFPLLEVSTTLSSVLAPTKRAVDHSSEYSWLRSSRSKSRLGSELTYWPFSIRHIMRGCIVCKMATVQRKE